MRGGGTVSSLAGDREEGEPQAHRTGRGLDTWAR